MKALIAWILFVAPVAIAFPATEDKSTVPFKNGSLPVNVPKRISLDELLQAFNFQDPGTRPSGRSKRSSCPIPSQLLSDLAGSIRKIHAYVPQSGDSPLTIKEPLAAVPADKGSACDQAKLKLQTNVDYLSTIYLILLINGASLNEGEFNKLKKLYDNVHETLQDDIKIITDTIDNESKGQMDEVIREKSLLEARLDRVVNNLEYNVTIQKKLRDNMLDLVVSEIYRSNNNNFDTAKEKFLELGDQGLVFAIVDKMAEKPNNDNLLKFIKELPWMLHRMLGYRAMLDKGNLDLSIFTLEYDYKELVGVSNDPKVVAEIKHDIDYVANKMAPLIKEKINSIVTQIATKEAKNYNDIIQYSKSHKNEFNAHLEEIVEKVYENTDNDVDIIEQILLFSDALTQIAQSARVYIKLYKLMESNRDISFTSALKIAFKVKELSLMKNHVNTPSEVKKEMEELKERAPDSVKSIIWGQVCIKNEEMDGYLHASDSYDNSRKNINLSPNRDLWSFESNDNAISFKMKNMRTNEYLYAEGDDLAYSPHKRRIFGWLKDVKLISGQYWQLEDISLKKGQFLIKNKARNEYLNAELLPEKTEGNGNVDQHITAIMLENPELATQIKLLLQKGKADRKQVYTWRRRTRGNNPEWMFVDSKNCQ